VKKGMRKTQTKLIERAIRWGYSEDMLRHMKREDFTTKQLQDMDHAFGWICHISKKMGADLSEYIPKIVSATEQKDVETYRAVCSEIYSLLPRVDGEELRRQENYAEICKIAEPKDGDGVFILDASLVFRYSNPEIVKMSFSLMDLNGNWDSAKDIGVQGVMNHRFPNKDYLTFSAKKGRKICGFGYPVVLPRSILNNIMFVEIRIDIGEHFIKHALPISISVTKEHPVAKLHFSLNMLDPNDDNWISVDADKSYATGFWDSCEPLYGDLIGDETVILSPCEDDITTLSIEINADNDAVLDALLTDFDKHQISVTGRGYESI